ncbi:MAG TPA: YihY/virulence factor BrkB family protein, partial [Propionicimonas sp.]|nr:YihY/virulence factor BrkB family protein [Propionicimonas sp.]
WAPMTDRAARDTGVGTAPVSQASKPTEIPVTGWWQVLKRGWREASEDQVPLLGAGVAFFGFLSLFPALAAFTLVYGLVADPATIADQVRTLTAALPPEASALLVDQLQQLTSTPRQSLGWGLALTIVLALWSASGGVGNLITAINIAYDEPKKRGFVKEKLLALGVTIAAVLFMALVLTLVAGVPVVLGFLDVSGALRWVIEAVRWLLLAALVMLALAVLYRVAPDRDAPRFRWVSAGAVTATVLWLVASAAFSLYVTFLGSYARTYGAFAGVVLMMLWLWLTSYAILLGAEINAESEEQTARDTTRGPERPLGSRGAVKADSLPPPAR